MAEHLQRQPVTDTRLATTDASQCRPEWLNSARSGPRSIGEVVGQRENDRRKTTRGEAPYCCFESESIGLLSLDPGTPIARFPVVRCDCQHDDFIIAVQVHDRKWKALWENSASAVPVRCAHIREFSCYCERPLNDRCESLA